MLNYSKLKNSELIHEKCGRKSYLKNLNVMDARIIFKKRSSMMQHVKCNYMNDARNVKSLWQCNSCLSNIDNMDHVLWCQSYKELRCGKQLEKDKDLANYLHDVFRIRNKLEMDK